VVDAATGETTHTVKSGDTLGKLATEYHTTVKAIQSANGLADTRIRVGQKLKIPKAGQ
jgi:membrane-bound lytic murein transglycosylase D